MESTQKKLYDIEDYVEKPINGESEEDDQNDGEESKEEDLGKIEESKKEDLTTYSDTSKRESSGSRVNVKTGTSHPQMSIPPYHIKDAEEFEPLYTPRDNILEDCLRREAE